ncbi:MAG: polysaccharide biosynthesis protein [Bacteroidales bacterium]
MTTDELAWIATGRHESLFAADVARREGELRSALGGARVLVIGGAGSIGSATVREIVRYQPRVLHVIDTSENNLVELVRDLRGARLAAGVELLTLPLDYGSPVMHRFLLAQPPYEYVFNFAAIKHVRSERDVCSLLQMIDTNILKQATFLDWLRAARTPVRYFSVSTDKAANPVNVMGASKRFAEHVTFAGPGDGPLTATSARFANVAFSDGSLLHGWGQRLAKRQPIAVPRDTRRYFISAQEAGQICLLAGVVGRPRQLLIPRLDAAVDLRDLGQIACAYLEAHGYRAAPYADEGQAMNDVGSLRDAGAYPVLHTALDTSGEKPYEEFVGAGEQAIDIGMEQLQGVRATPLDGAAVAEALGTFRRAIADPTAALTKQDVVAILGSVIPHFSHVETGRSLDDRL